MANYKTGADRDNLEKRPWVRMHMLRDIAIGEETQAAIGKKYGVTREAVNRFKRRHLEEINDLMARAGDEFAGILVSAKANRLSMYQSMIDEAYEKGQHKLVAQMLRQVAEEMGHLPSRMQISGAVDVHTSYTITGADGVPVNLANLR